MFERYTEAARRSVFFARYEVSQCGGDAIDTEHLLLGLIRANDGLAARIFRENQLSLSAVQAIAQESKVTRDRVSTSVDIPLSAAAKGALLQAAREADEMGHEHVGCEHILLGLVWEKDGLAAQVLAKKGIRLSRVRDDVRGAEKRGGPAEQAKERYPRIGEIVHYHVRGERGLIASPAIVTSVVDAGEGRVTLTVFSATGTPVNVSDARPGLFRQRPEEGRWTWMPPD
jgi:ATP-dependent Clp protease ATP-binding subunit ClpC